MQAFEYKIVPAPKRAAKIKGLKTTEDRFARTLTDTVNELARDGWDYLRADTLPVEERVGLTGRTTTFQHMLVFRRALDQPAAKAPHAEAAPAPVLVASAREPADAPPAYTPVRLFTPAPTGEAPPLGAANDRKIGQAAE